MATKFSMGRDINGYNSFSLAFSDTNYNMVLAAGVAQSVTIPSDEDHYRVIFSFTPGASVWVANNSTAAAPSGASALSASQLNPVARDVKKGDVLSLITTDTSAAVGVQIYAV